MKNEEAGMPMGGVGSPTYTPQPGPDYNNQMPPQGGYTGQPMQQQQSMPQEQYPGGQYPQAQTQYPQSQPQYPTQTPYPQEQQVPMQSYPSPQGEYPPQYGGSATQHAGYPGPRDGASEMQSPLEAPKMNDSHQG